MYEYVKVEDFTKDGKCSDCGKCCSNLLPLSVGEIKRIKAYIKRRRIKEQRHNFVSGFDMTCPFRDEANRKCTIYDIRPEICRQFKCNNTIEDIKKNKMDLHKKYDVVLMRNEFFRERGRPYTCNIWCRNDKEGFVWRVSFRKIKKAVTFAE